MTQNKESLVRIEFGHEPVEKRIGHFREFTIPLSDADVRRQSERCLHCGTPFCSSSCPLHNRPVDFNRLVLEGKWRAAWECLSATNPFPEFTSRVCPRLCEAGCMQYYLTDSAVGIQTIERAIVDRAWKAGWVKPVPCPVKTGKKVAVIGSGPAGLACAQQLARVGHSVTVYEKAARPGGLLRYGISDFKLDKEVLDRRIDQMKAEGVKFVLSTSVGCRKFENGVANPSKRFVTAQKVLDSFDAVVLACGSEVPRDLSVPGREGEGVHFALELLQGQNRAVSGECEAAPVTSNGCDVAVIGGGDTGSDCVGIARRQGAGRIYQIDVTSCPPESVDKDRTWPDWPRIQRTSTSHEEGCERIYDTSTKEIIRNAQGQVTAIRVVGLNWTKTPEGRFRCTEVEGTEKVIAVSRVYLAMGFVHPAAGILEAFGVQPDARGNAQAAKGRDACAYRTSVDKVFACGDVRSGQSLVVRALSEGRSCAASVDRFLSGATRLPQLA